MTRSRVYETHFRGYFGDPPMLHTFHGLPLPLLDQGSRQVLKGSKLEDEANTFPTNKVANTHSLIVSCHEAHFNHHPSRGTLFCCISRPRSLRHCVRQSQRLALHCRLLRRRERPAHEGIPYFRVTAVVPQHQCCTSRRGLELNSVWVVLAHIVRGEIDQRYRRRSYRGRLQPLT